MATSLLMGFDTGSTESANAGAATSQTSVVRSGSHALQLNPSAATGYIQVQAISAGGTLMNFVQSCRLYLRIGSLPSVIWPVVAAGLTGAGVNCSLRLNTDGTLALWAGTPGNGTHVLRSTSSLALSADSLWHEIEFDCGWSSGGGMRVFVDGTLWASDVTDTGVTADTLSYIGDPNTSVTTNVYVDDVVWDDSTLGGTRSGWKLLLLVPTSDNAISGSWVAGAGGTTGLFNAVDSIPPVGVALASATNTSQIKDAAKETTANYDANCTSYSSAGIQTADTVNSVMAIANHGLSATGTDLTGALVIVSNPSGQIERTFDFDNSGFGSGPAAGTFPTGWFWSYGPVTSSPSVTRGTPPVVRVGRRTATKTTACMVDSMGIYVEYTPVARAVPRGLRAFQAVRRSATFFSSLDDNLPWRKLGRGGLFIPDLVTV